MSKAWRSARPVDAATWGPSETGANPARPASSSSRPVNPPAGPTTRATDAGISSTSFSTAQSPVAASGEPIRRSAAPQPSTNRSNGTGGRTSGTARRSDCRAASRALRCQRSTRRQAASAREAWSLSHSKGCRTAAPSSVAFSTIRSARCPGGGAKARVTRAARPARGTTGRRMRTRAPVGSAVSTSASNSRPSPVKTLTRAPAPMRSTVTMWRLCSGERATTRPAAQGPVARKRRGSADPAISLRAYECDSLAILPDGAAPINGAGGLPAACRLPAGSPR
ncbi:MAG: hypothetical protein AMK73_06000 [Planctomycetes bacterium SM23_32]|nr:MAG: hypothetical protein AMK73_06000 [Planctomycetes bacterium SM23_32]